MKFRSTISIAAGAALAIGLVGCTAGGEPTTPGASDSRCTSTPVAGGAITVAKQNETLSLSPYSTPGGFGDTEALNMVFETLVRMDPTGKSQDLVGGVADEWSTSDDGLTHTFHIREGAKFSNGRQVTAADVKYTLDNWSNPDVSQWASFARGYDSTTVVDDSTVQVNMTEPIGGFLYSLAMVTAGIIPQEEAEAAGDSFFDAPIGSGPFVVDEWVKGSSISFVKNDNYWDTSGPLLDSVAFRFVTDDNSRTLALRSGDVQMVDNVPWSQVEALQSEASLTIDEFSIPSWILLSLNNQQGPFADQNVRQALSLALVSRIVEPDALEAEGRALVDDMLHATPLGLRLTKEALNHAIDAGSLEAVIAMEDRNQVLSSQSEDFDEGVKAFLEKRKPRYA